MKMARTHTLLTSIFVRNTGVKRNSIELILAEQEKLNCGVTDQENGRERGTNPLRSGVADRARPRFGKSPPEKHVPKLYPKLSCATQTPP